MKLCGRCERTRCWTPRYCSIYRHNRCTPGVAGAWLVLIEIANFTITAPESALATIIGYVEMFDSSMLHSRICENRKIVKIPEESISVVACSILSGRTQRTAALVGERTAPR